MPSLPRIITVDPTGNAARVVRATIDLTEYACRQIDVPSGEEALEELKLGGGNLLVSALNLEDMRAFDLAEAAHDIQEQLGIVVLAEDDDPPMDADTQREYGFVYMQRPLELAQFADVLIAGMRGTDLFDALHKPQAAAASEENEAPVPKLDVDRAKPIISTLVTDLGAMSILLIARDGEILLEMGTANFVAHDALLSAVKASLRANIDMRDTLGGDATMLQFYDGDDRDVYTLSVGLHHLLCIAYDGEKGQRQFGMVNSLGRRAAMDLIALLGAEAFFIRRPEPKPEPETDPIPRKRMTRVMSAVEDDNIALERATELSSNGGTELETVAFEPIPDEEFDASFLDQLGELDDSAADDLFSMENLEKLETNVKSSKTLDWDSALNLGLVGDE